MSCHQAESGNQPDIIWVNREKASLGIDEIRAKLCNTMDIRPFSSPYKVYIVPEAEKMTEAAQNALLKTIEEPPEYGVVILLTSNISELLPTIQSRCLTLEFRPLSTATEGEFARSEDFIERKDKILSLLHNVGQMDLSEMLALIKDLGTRKDEVRDYIDLMSLWYRDVLLFKATKNLTVLLLWKDRRNITGI